MIKKKILSEHKDDMDRSDPPCEPALCWAASSHGQAMRAHITAFFFFFFTVTDAQEFRSLNFIYHIGKKCMNINEKNSST